MTELAPRGRAALLVIWCSFLTAAIATMLVFAFVDPAELHVADGAPVGTSRRTVYALGFVLFWASAAGAAALALWMSKPGGSAPDRTQ